MHSAWGCASQMSMTALCWSSEACSRVGTHLTKLDPILEIGPKVGGGCFEGCSFVNCGTERILILSRFLPLSHICWWIWKFHSWCRCTMGLASMHSELRSNASSYVNPSIHTLGCNICTVFHTLGVMIPYCPGQAPTPQFWQFCGVLFRSSV